MCVSFLWAFLGKGSVSPKEMPKQPQKERTERGKKNRIVFGLLFWGDCFPRFVYCVFGHFLISGVQKHLTNNYRPFFVLICIFGGGACPVKLRILRDCFRYIRKLGSGEGQRVHQDSDEGGGGRISDIDGDIIQTSSFPGIGRDRL
jgi:hypothetical protein